LILLGLVAFFYNKSASWLDDFSFVGPVMLVILRFLIFLFGASLVVRLLAMIYREETSTLP